MSDDFHAFCCSHDPAFNLTDFDVGRDEVEPMIRRMRQELDAVTRWCWTPERIHRLRRILTSEP